MNTWRKHIQPRRPRVEFVTAQPSERGLPRATAIIGAVGKRASSRKILVSVSNLKIGCSSRV